MSNLIYSQPANRTDINATMTSLKNNGINTFIVDNMEQARDKVLQLIPRGAEVMEMTSVTLDAIGLSQALRSKEYILVKDKLNTIKDEREKKRLGAAPQFAIGSVHAVTHAGEIFIASATGSQLSAYAYGADKVIWLVGTQKIVKDKETAMKRITEYTLPLESERARKAYGVEGSAINKMLMINKEINPDRIHIIFINQNIGF